MNEQENNQQQQQPFRGFPIKFDIYARSEQEVEDLRMAIVAFIGHHARQGRAIDAARLAKAIGNWDKNPLVKNHIINYFR
jgi:hypothetical protein